MTAPALDPLLAATRDCVMDVGLKRTTLADVARRAGVSRMTVYRQYGDLSAIGHGANMAFRRTTLEAVGGFDEAMGAGAPIPGAEDKDIFWRVVRAGWRAGHEPSADRVYFPICPHCGGVERISKMGGASTRKGLYKCYQCRKPFTVRMGTIFEASKVPLHVWLQAIYLIAGSKKGISSNQLHRTLGVTLKTAWFMSHRIREAMREGQTFEGSSRFSTYASFVKLPHTVFAMPFALVGALIAHLPRRRSRDPRRP